MTRSAILRYPGGEAKLSSEELEALAWVIKVGGHSGPIATLSNAGGTFDASARGRIATFVTDAQTILAKTLEVSWKKYGTNVCLASVFGWKAVQRYNLAYVNRNVDPPS